MTAAQRLIRCRALHSFHYETVTTISPGIWRFAMNEKVLAKRRSHVSESEPRVTGGEQDVPAGVLPQTSPESFQRLRKTHRLQKRPEFEHIVLLLQGGGALGAYQAGVYEALAEAD